MVINYSIMQKRFTEFIKFGPSSSPTEAFQVEEDCSDFYATLSWCLWNVW